MKITLPGPFTMAQQAQDEHYHDKRALALDLAAAVTEEIHDLFAAGADVVQSTSRTYRRGPRKRASTPSTSLTEP